MKVTNQFSPLLIAALVALMLLTTANRVLAQAPTSQQSRAALAAQCDALLESAIRSPYGWGWAADAPHTDAIVAPGRRPAPISHKLVPIDAAESSVLGIELFWAGQALNEEKYRQAAFEVARGVASIRARTGHVRALGIMGTSSGTTDVLADVPDRFATRAALGLMLSLIDADNAPPAAPDRRWAERLKGPAAQCAFWLAKQQTNVGAWPSAYPPDARTGSADRIVRIDEAGNRDNLCTVLLAGEVLDDANMRRYGDRAADELISLRLTDFRTNDRLLWGTATTLDGDPPRKFPELNHGFDLLASRYAMQALLAAYLVNLRKTDNDALLDAAHAVTSLQKVDGKWRRFYNQRGSPIELPLTQPADFFDPNPTVPDDGSASAFGLLPILDAVTQIDAVGGKKYADFLAASRPIKVRLVEQIAGLSDDSLGTRLNNGSSAPMPSNVWPKSSRPAQLWELLRNTTDARTQQ